MNSVQKLLMTNQLGNWLTDIVIGTFLSTKPTVIRCQFHLRGEFSMNSYANLKRKMVTRAKHRIHMHARL